MDCGDLDGDFLGLSHRFEHLAYELKRLLGVDNLRLQFKDALAHHVQVEHVFNESFDEAELAYHKTEQAQCFRPFLRRHFSVVEEVVQLLRNDHGGLQRRAHFVVDDRPLNLGLLGLRDYLLVLHDLELLAYLRGLVNESHCDRRLPKKVQLLEAYLDEAVGVLLRAGAFILKLEGLSQLLKLGHFFGPNQLLDGTVIVK